MEARYLLPCGCGQKQPVSAAEAGQVIRCACGQKLEVPTLRALRQLEAATPESGKETGWNLRKAVFVIGLVIAIGGALFALYCWQTGPRPVDTSRMTPVETWYLWQQIRSGLPRRYLRFDPYRQWVQMHQFWLVFAGIITALGVATMIGSLFVPPVLKSIEEEEELEETENQEQEEGFPREESAGPSNPR